jgi:hypothetical protein
MTGCLQVGRGVKGTSRCTAAVSAVLSCNGLCNSFTAPQVSEA